MLKKITVTAALLLSLAGQLRAENFDAWWPWIYRNIQNLSTNTNTIAYVTSHTNLWDKALTNGTLSASNAWAIAVASNKFTLSYPTNTGSISSNAVPPRAGIWSMNYFGQVALLPAVIEVEAGLWKMNTSAQIVVSGNIWTDSFWLTNGLGQLELRALP